MPQVQTCRNTVCGTEHNKLVRRPYCDKLLQLGKLDANKAWPYLSLLVEMAASHLNWLVAKYGG